MTLNKVLLGYRMTTAEILYRMPDPPNLLQVFIWQELDLFPKLPVLNKFLDFWKVNIEGKLVEVRVGLSGIFCPTDIKYYDREFTLQ